MTRTEQVRTIQQAYDSIPDMQDGFKEVREYLFSMNVASERQHRRGEHNTGLSVANAARLFVVKHLIDGFKEPDRFTVNDITSIRNEVLYAQAYAKRFHLELAPWAANWSEKFESVDYAALMAVRS